MKDRLPTSSAGPETAKAGEEGEPRSATYRKTIALIEDRICPQLLIACSLSIHGGHAS